MKYLVLLLSLISMLSCNNNETPAYETNDQEQQQPATVYQNAVSDTGSTVPQARPPHDAVFPAGKFSSVSEIMSQYFSEGSTKDEVRKVQGIPDFTESAYPMENWYYGASLVQFKGPIVGAVRNSDGKLRHVDYFSLALSPDQIEIEFYHILNSRINRR